MKRNQSFERARKALLPFTLGLLMAMLLVLSGSRLYHAGAADASAHAVAEAAPAEPAPIARPWTAVASTGAIDETSLPHFIFGIGSGGAPAALGFHPSSQSLLLQARYNVTNTFHGSANPNVPGWTTLELIAEAPGTSTVTASLYRIERCTGKVLSPTPSQPNAPLCSVQITNQATATCKTCNFAATLVDFTQYLYFVDLRFRRPNAQTRPYAYTLRVF